MSPEPFELERDFFKSILDDLYHVSVMVCDTEPVGAIRFVNPFFCERNGVTYEQALGMNAYEIASLPDGDMAKVNDAIGRVMAGEEAVLAHGYFRSVGSDDSFWGSLIVRRLDRPGQTPCLIFATIDLSLLGLQAETARMSAEQVRAITTAAHDGVALIDRGGEILYWNVAAEKMTGVTAGKAVGERLCDLVVPEEERPLFREELEERIDVDKHRIFDTPFETRMFDAEGAPFPVEISASPVRHEEDGWGGVLFIRNITTRKANEEALINARETADKASCMKDQFVTMVSHDIRSPISGVIEALRLCESMLKGNMPEQVARLLNQSRAACEGVLQMADTLLDLSRIRSGRVTCRSKSAGAHDFLTAVVARSKPVADAKGIALSVQAASGVRLFIDPDLFAQVIQNLVANALKFTERGGEVVVTVRESDPCTVVVRDTGVGIPPDRLPHLFVAETAQSTRGTGGEPGHGFGLPLCAELMRIQGGDITVESYPGAGTLFYCHLPENRPTVLVVDDEALDRLATIDFLSDIGVTVIEAEHGEAALPLLETDAPHLALIDLTMPYMDGFTLLSKIRGNPRTATLPVIVMTAATGAEVRNRAFALGADDFVVKPIVPDDFLPRVMRYLAVNAIEEIHARR